MANLELGLNNHISIFVNENLLRKYLPWTWKKGKLSRFTFTFSLGFKARSRIFDLKEPPNY